MLLGAVARQFLSGSRANIIARRQAERVESSSYVCHRQGNRLKPYNRAWRTAQEKVGLPGKLMHDSQIADRGHNRDKHPWQKPPSSQVYET